MIGQDKIENAGVKEQQDTLPTEYWLRKIHKRPYKATVIANSCFCITI